MQAGNESLDEMQRAESIRHALAKIEKHAKVVKIRAIVFQGAAVVAAVWFALDTRHPLTLPGVECRVIIVLGLLMGVCTERVRSVVNKNTRVILEAIQQSHQQF